MVKPNVSPGKTTTPAVIPVNTISTAVCNGDKAVAVNAVQVAKPNKIQIKRKIGTTIVPVIR